MKNLVSSLILGLAMTLPAHADQFSDACTAGGYTQKLDCDLFLGAVIKEMRWIKEDHGLNMVSAKLTYRPKAYQQGWVRLTTPKATCTFFVDYYMGDTATCRRR